MGIGSTAKVSEASHCFKRMDELMQGKIASRKHSGERVYTTSAIVRIYFRVTQ